MGVLNKLFGYWFENWRPSAVTHYMGAVNTQFNREAYEHACVRAIIDCIATHTAKAEALHVVVDENGRIKDIKRASPYAKLLNHRPNDLMTGYDLKYKLISQLESHTTALAYIKWDGKKPDAIYPVNYRQFEIAKVKGGGWAVLFTDAMGDEHKLPLEECVVLRKFYNQHDTYGDGNKPLYDVLDLMKAADKGLADAIAVSNKVRLVHKKKTAYVSPLDKEFVANTVTDRLDNAGKNGGVLTIDAAEELAPFNVPVYSANATQMQQIRGSLLSYWRISDEILLSKYTEQHWQAFYEAVIEPLLIMLGQAFTNTCFTQAERDKGNRIMFSNTMLIHASMQSKVNLIRSTKELGLFTDNELRELLGYPPVEGGDKRQVSLNYVNADKQDKYQTGEEDDEDGDQEQEVSGTPV